MFTHGVSSAMLFLIVGVIYDRAHHRNLDDFGGIGLQMPWYTGVATIGFFASLGLPAFLAYATIGVEVIGGIALIAGVFTRYVALAMVPVLLGATFVHSGSGWLFSNEGGGWEFPAFWAVALVVQALLGDGAFALRVPTKNRRPAEATA